MLLTFISRPSPRLVLLTLYNSSKEMPQGRHLRAATHEAIFPKRNNVSDLTATCFAKKDKTDGTILSHVC